jgi:hypothetical protein
MALTSKSLILYGLRITPLNRSLDFKTALIGVERQATLRLGFYSLSQLLTEIVRAMQEADPANEYTATADRTYSGGTENRVTIGTTTGTFLSLLFGTGSRTASSVAPVIGFPTVDQTGSLNYLGVSSCGTVLIPDYTAYTYLGPEFMRTVFGSVNIAADGSKEAIVFQVQRFLQCEFKFEQKAKVISEWTPFLNWGIQQRPYARDYCAHFVLSSDF